MWIVLLIFTVTFVVCAKLVWPRRDDGPHADTVRAAPGRPDGPESLEGALVNQLATGAITRGQYARAMEQLAARDEERHPMSVPPEVGGAA
jgi:hypothetical protein